MDKIGAFRFTIKGWSVTAVIAASAAATAATNLSTTTMFIISSGLSVMLFFFFLFEFEQVKLSRIFGDRARRLESSFRLMDGSGSLPQRARIPVPYTAHDLVWSLRQQRLFALSHRGSDRVEPFRHRIANWWRIIIHADVCFYLVLALMAVLLPLIPHHRSAAASRKSSQYQRSQIAQPIKSTAPALPTGLPATTKDRTARGH